MLASIEEAALCLTLGYVASELNPRSYLEIGCCEGDSLCEVIRNSPSLHTVAVIDTWGTEYGGTGRGSSRHIMKMAESTGYQGTLLALSGRSQDILPLIEAQFDLVLVDGDHSLKGAASDLEQGWRLLRGGGVLVFDDILHPCHSYLNGLLDKFVRQHDALVLARTTVGNGTAAIRKW